MSLLVLLRGGGDLASGVALRLFKSGFQVVITELPQPLTVRRSVSFGQAVYNHRVMIEGIEANLASSQSDIHRIIQKGAIPVVVDPGTGLLKTLKPDVLVDGRMKKTPPETGMGDARLVIGLGPGFTAGVDCHAVIETQRGHFLGRVIWQGQAESDTRIPESVLNHQSERVLRAPKSGLLLAHAEIGAHIQAGQIIAEIDDQSIMAPFDGILRGLVHDGLEVTTGMKIGDLDPRDEDRLIHFVSDKSLAVGGGVLEAILSTRELLDDFHRGC